MGKVYDAYQQLENKYSQASETNWYFLQFRYEITDFAKTFKTIVGIQITSIPADSIKNQGGSL